MALISVKKGGQSKTLKALDPLGATKFLGIFGDKKPGAKDYAKAMAPPEAYEYTPPPDFMRTIASFGGIGPGGVMGPVGGGSNWQQYGGNYNSWMGNQLADEEEAKRQLAAVIMMRLNGRALNSQGVTSPGARASTRQSAFQGGQGGLIELLRARAGR